MDTNPTGVVMASTEDTQLVLKSMDRLELMIDKLSTRLDSFPVTYVSRTEYEMRHSSMDGRLKDLEVARITLPQHANEEHSKMMDKVSAMVQATQGNMIAMEQRIQGRFDTADQKLDEKNVKKWDWKIPFIVAGVSLLGTGLLQFLPHLFGK